MFAWLVLACASPPADTAPVAVVETSAPEETAAPDTSPPDDTGDSLPSDYIYDDLPDDGAPPLGQAELQAGLAEVWGFVQLLDPLYLHETYRDQRLGLGDDACPWYDPNYYELYDQWYWYDYCTSTTGGAFSGYGISYFYEDYVSGDATYSELAYFFGDGVITDVDGTSLLASGYAQYQDYGYWWDDYRYVYAYTSGTYRWTAPEAAGTWLDTELVAELSQSVTTSATYGSRSWILGGTLSFPGERLVAVDFDDFALLNAAAGSSCEIEPGGRMSVRDHAGNWYDLEFQGAIYAGAPVFAPLCDGCADVVHDGQVIYQVCPDTAGLLGWQDRPW